MFEVGDYVVYGIYGVCKVEEIGAVDIVGIPKDRMYYTLVPIYAKGSKVFSPTDNKKVVMRPIISRKEAESIIDNIKEVEALWINDEKKREDIYKQALRKCDCVEWIRIIKTLYARKQSRIAEGKKMTFSDEKYLHTAQEHLYGELAIVLGMQKENVEKFIFEKCEMAIV